MRTAVSLQSISEIVLAITDSFSDATISVAVRDIDGAVVTTTETPQTQDPVRHHFAPVQQPGTWEVLGIVEVVGTDCQPPALLNTIAHLIASNIQALLSCVSEPVRPVEKQICGTTRIAELEYKAILEALALTKGAVAPAALHLGLSRSTIYRRIQLFHIAQPPRQ